MKLGAKFNLVLLAVFAVGLVLAGITVRRQVGDNARKESLDTAGLMMESALAVRKYTSDYIRPLLIRDLDRVFHPETVPAFAATEMFGALRSNRPDITYKEATLNPSNPRDKATDWESGIVEYFRNHTDAKEYSGERQWATGPALFVARPIKVGDSACLKCHGEPSELPLTVKAKYGDQQGVGWKLNEIVGAQIATVPTTVPDQRADSEFRTFMVSLVAVFLVVIGALNVLLNRMVIAPIRRMASAADKMSQGDLSEEEMPTGSGDEMGTLASSFNRMTRSLKKAMEMIDRG